MIDNRLLAKQLLSLCTDWQGKPIVNTVTRDVLHQAAAALVSCTVLKETLEQMVTRLESELKAARVLLSNYENPQ